MLEEGLRGDKREGLRGDKRQCLRIDKHPRDLKFPIKIGILKIGQQHYV